MAFFKKFKRWQKVLLLCLAGAFVGCGCLFLYMMRFHTYLVGDDPSACVNCHRESEETLRQNVYERQEKCLEVRDKLEDILAKAHIEAKFAWDKGATEAEMKDALQNIRKSQWRWDYAVASHGASFHAPQEVVRLMGNGISYAQEARLQIAKVLAKHGYTGDVPMPDLSTKAKAQAYIGLDMKGMTEKKEKFMKDIVPQWLSIAKENGKLLDY